MSEREIRSIRVVVASDDEIVVRQIAGGLPIDSEVPAVHGGMAAFQSEVRLKGKEGTGGRISGFHLWNMPGTAFQTFPKSLKRA
jgi:hypothetical protein